MSALGDDAAFEKLASKMPATELWSVLLEIARERAKARTSALAGVDVLKKPLEHAYHSGGVRFVLWVTASDGSEVPLGDGGSFDWMGTLNVQQEERVRRTGLAAQLIPLRFKLPREGP